MALSWKELQEESKRIIFDLFLRQLTLTPHLPPNLLFAPMCFEMCLYLILTRLKRFYWTVICHQDKAPCLHFIGADKMRETAKNIVVCILERKIDHGVIVYCQGKAVSLVNIFKY